MITGKAQSNSRSGEASEGHDRRCDDVSIGDTSIMRCHLHSPTNTENHDMSRFQKSCMTSGGCANILNDYSLDKHMNLGPAVTTRCQVNSQHEILVPSSHKKESICQSPENTSHVLSLFSSSASLGTSRLGVQPRSFPVMA